MEKYYGEQLITLGTAIAFKLAQSLTPNELGILGSLFSVVGDQLGLLADAKEACDSNYNVNL